MIQILLLTALLLITVWHKGFVQPAEAGYITTADGLSESFVTCIYQDSRGFMWFGTKHGLNKYDGYAITQYYHSDTTEYSLSGDYIRSIFEDDEGILWIGTDNNGLNRYDKNLDRFEAFRPGSEEDFLSGAGGVLAITNLGQGKLLLGASNGLYSFDTRGGEYSVPGFYTGTGEIPASAVVSVLAEETDVWAGTEKGLFRISRSDGMIRRYFTGTGQQGLQAEKRVYCVFRTLDGVLLAGTSNGLYTFNRTKDTFDNYRSVPEIQTLLDGAEIQSVTEDGKGNIWIGTFGKGLIMHNRERGEGKVFTSTEGGSTPKLNNDFIYSVMCDNAGMLWVGTYGGGVNKIVLPSGQFGQLLLPQSEGKGYTGNDVYALFADGNELWAGTDNGLGVFDLAKDTAFFFLQSTTLPDGLSSSKIFAVRGDSHGNIWIGTADKGLNRLSAADRRKGVFRFRHFRHKNENLSLASDKVLCLFEDRSGHLWVGTGNGVTVLDPGGGLVEGRNREVAASGLFSGIEVNTFYQREDSSYWAGTSAGLIRSDSSGRAWMQVVLSCLPESDRMAPVIYSIAEDRNGMIWLGTDNSGLIRYDAQTGVCIRYTVQNGLPDNVVYGIIPLSDGSLWISSNNGIARILPQGASGEISVVRYNTTNGLPVDGCNIGAFASGDDGALFFGSYRGIIHFYPDDVAGNIRVPPVYITGFNLFFKPVKISDRSGSVLSEHITETGKITLNHRQNVVQFEFAALNYHESEKNQYAFMLEGLENNWNYVNTQRTAQYYYLPPGEYVFRVIASNNTGVWNTDGAALSLTIAPPFTQTVWFYLMVVAAIILTGSVILHIRTYRLRIIKRNLEEEVERRTSELKKANSELNRALEELKRTQTHLINTEKMASLGQLTAGIAHEINNPINFVSGNVRPLKRDIDNIIAILKGYEEVVRTKYLEGDFTQVTRLKEQNDYHLLIQEVYSLLEGIEEGASRTANIVKSLRNFSRLDEEELKKANIHEGLDATLMILKNKLKDRIEIVQEYGEIPAILCYPGQLNQVFLNILNNAIDAITGKGTIIIKTCIRRDELIISFSDNGAGIPPEVVKRVFDPFYTTKEIGKGTGLGLSISYGIIGKHNGTIKVNSIPGEGSEFIISLPVIKS